MNEKTQFHTYLQTDYHNQLRKWAKQSNLSMGQVVELLVFIQMPSKLKLDPIGWGWKFDPIPTTRDIAVDGTVESRILKRIRRK